MKIIILGAGNVATHLAFALHHAGHEILQIFSRTEESAAALATLLHTHYCTEITTINDKAELYIYAVSDSALDDLISIDFAPDALHVHTAGSVPIHIFEGKRKHFGAFYPLQTFSKNKAVNFAEIPVFVEGSAQEVVEKLMSLASTISNQNYVLNSEQRMKMHLSAVFCCNFVNYFYNIAYQLVNENSLPFDVLMPLIKETASKITELNPYQAQTGPARRNDIPVMEKHLTLLNHHPQWQQLYNQLSRMILNEYLHKP
jgi:predicted short-subunit dehydrogenase-like oxidoreductase (DUF2520 family)